MPLGRMMMRQHLAPLTSLRFFAAALVVFEHFFGFKYGHAGVSFFFSLSGFILAYNYAGKLSDRSEIYVFLCKRIARIYPIHALTLLAAIPTALLIDFRHDIGLAVPAFFANILLLQSFVPIKSIYFGFNSVSWSISDEAFFYILFPVLSAVCYGMHRAWACIALSCTWLAMIILMLKWRAFGLDPAYQHWFFYINPLIRITEFVAGMLVGLRFIAVQRHAVSVWYEALAVLAVVLVILLAYRVPENAASLTYGLLFVGPSLFILYVFANGSGAISAFLAAPLLVLLGEASFALYMTHQLFLRYMILFFGASSIVKIVALVLAVPIAVICYKMFEKPGQEWVLRRLTAQ